MNKLAYTTIQIYIVLLIFYMLFGAEGNFFYIYYFSIEKGLICMLVYSLLRNEILKNRKVLYISFIIVQLALVAYIIKDPSRTFVKDPIAILIACSAFISPLVVTLIKQLYDRKK